MAKQRKEPAGSKVESRESARRHWQRGIAREQPVLLTKMFVGPPRAMATRHVVPPPSTPASSCSGHHRMGENHCPTETHTHIQTHTQRRSSHRNTIPDILHLGAQFLLWPIEHKVRSPKHKPHPCLFWFVCVFSVRAKRLSILGKRHEIAVLLALLLLLLLLTVVIVLGVGG